LQKGVCDIIINDIELMKEEGEKTVQELTAIGVKAMFSAADVSNFAACQKMNTRD